MILWLKTESMTNLSDIITGIYLSIVSSICTEHKGQAVSLMLCDRTEKYIPSRDSNRAPSAIRADVLSQLD